jgi:hypothetical protein
MIEINGDKYYHVFTAGKYPQGEISDDFLKQAANNYNPVNFHEAPGMDRPILIKIIQDFILNMIGYLEVMML